MGAESDDCETLCNNYEILMPIPLLIVCDMLLLMICIKAEQTISILSGLALVLAGIRTILDIITLYKNRKRNTVEDNNVEYELINKNLQV